MPNFILSIALTWGILFTRRYIDNSVKEKIPSHIKEIKYISRVNLLLGFIFGFLSFALIAFSMYI